MLPKLMSGFRLSPMSLPLRTAAVAAAQARDKSAAAAVQSPVKAVAAAL
jgi:hypothetical protein